MLALPPCIGYDFCSLALKINAAIEGGRRMALLRLGGVLAIAIYVGVCQLAVTPRRAAAEYFVSFSVDETIATNLFADEDIVSIDLSTPAIYESLTSVFTSGSQDNADLDALFLDENGDLYFSTTTTVFIDAGIDGGSGRMESGDVVVRYAADGTFSRYLADAGPNIDAFWISQGVPYLSLGTDSTVGSNNVAVTERMVFTLTDATDLSSGLVSVVLDSAELLLPPGAGSNRFDLDEGGTLTRDSGVVYQVDPNNLGAFDPTSPASVFADVSEELGEAVNVDALHQPASSSVIDADFNEDGSVNLADFTVWRDSLGASGLTTYDQGDADGDGIVDADDFDWWKAKFGASSTASTLGTSTVPEPSTTWMGCLLAAALLCIRDSRGRCEWMPAELRYATEARA
jgi:hypothetical protein